LGSLARNGAELESLVTTKQGAQQTHPILGMLQDAPRLLHQWQPAPPPHAARIRPQNMRELVEFGHQTPVSAHASRLHPFGTEDAYCIVTNNEKISHTCQGGRMHSGKIKWFNATKGYGFITSAAADEDVFVHYSELQIDGFKTIRNNAPVLFDLLETNKGPIARKVQLMPDDDATGVLGHGASDIRT
jgi:CspA family cold shock protein